MMALAGVIPLAGFWSKDEILHLAHIWKPSHWPFALGLIGAALTAFYMTRQMMYVFPGKHRASAHDHAHTPHESPWIMTAPLVVLAACAALLGFLGTPAWPWFQSYLNGGEVHVAFGHLFEKEVLLTMALSTAIGLGGIWLGWKLYANAGEQAAKGDVLEQWQPGLFQLLQRKYCVDELYELSVVKFNAWWARVCDVLDRYVWAGAVKGVSLGFLALSWLNRLFDEYVINLGFDKGCQRVRKGGGFASGLQGGQVQTYLRVIGIALVVFVLALTWGCGAL
jgi:NADH-quinone oxidoreductase subunit L